MTVKDALRGSGLPAAEAEVLLSRVLRRERPWLLSHAQDELTPEEWGEFARWTERRRKQEPVAYIIGEQEFYGRPFTVDRRVLIPRPATEGIVRRTLQFLQDGVDAVDTVDEGIVVIAKNIQRGSSTRVRTPTAFAYVVDVGTGSGCIAITLALERPDLRIIATDISPDALAVARMNAERHGVAHRIAFREGNGLAPVKNLTEAFLLVSNPPYIPSGNDLMADVKDFEPHVALFGGADGHAVVRELQQQAEAHPSCIGWVMEYGTVAP